MRELRLPVPYFKADLAGEGWRIDEVCIDFVNKREIDAVAFDVPACGAGGGETGIKTGAFSFHVFPWASSDTVDLAATRGCSSKILRRVSTVCLAIRLSDEDEDEPPDGDDSSIGGVIGRWMRGDFGVRRDDDDSAEGDLVMGSDRRSSIVDLHLARGLFSIVGAMELDARGRILGIREASTDGLLKEEGVDDDIPAGVR